MNLTGNKSTTVYVKPYTIVVDSEGSKTKGYSSTPFEMKGVISPLSGEVQVVMYGEQAKYMLEMYINAGIEIHERDGICINVKQSEMPDYEVVGIMDYKKCMQLTLKKRVANG